MIFANAAFIKPNVEFVREYTGTNYAPMFRKNIYLENTDNAKLYVCGLGYGYYYINGKKVTKDLFTAPVSEYRKTLWYNVYDVSHLLKKGENTFAVICGNGWYNEELQSVWYFDKAPWRDLPKFILRLEIDGKTALVSDGSWKCKPQSAIYFNQLRNGEYFDANLYDENWNKCDYDDSEWENALRDNTPPTGTFRECKCEPIREFEVYDAVAIHKVSHKKYVFDMGQNVSGYIRLTVDGNKGDELTIRYSELLNDDYSLQLCNMPNLYHGKGKEMFMTDKFICSGKKMTWSPKFAYHGFQYIEIDGISDINNIKVQSVFVHQDIKRRTTFECSNEVLNKLFDCGIKSCHSNMFYLLTDCPTREKFGWTNDAQGTAEQMLTNFKIEKLFEKWHQDIKDAMLSDGALPGIIPSNGWGYDWGNGPVSDGILFELPFRVYLHTGNPEMLKSSIDYFDRYFKYLDSNRNEKGLNAFGLPDWACPGRKPQVDSDFINLIFEYKFYGIAYVAAKVLGLDAKMQHYKSKMAEKKALANKLFTDDCGRCIIDHQTSVSMLIYYDICENSEPLKQQLKELIEKANFHHNCGMVGIRRLLIALNKCGLQEYAYKVLTASGYPGWKYWLENGATTLWEMWDVDDYDDSKNHHMYSDFMSWMIKTIVGITLKEDKCGEGILEINPYYFEDLSYAKCSYNSEFGKIDVAWNKTETGIDLEITIDEGVKAYYGGKLLDSGKTVIKI